MTQLPFARFSRLTVIGLVAFAVSALALAPLPAAAQAIGGDANGDGTLDVLDVTALMRHILELETAPGSPDCTGDSAVDVLDVVCLTNRILAGGDDSEKPIVTGLSPTEAKIGDTVVVLGRNLREGNGEESGPLPEVLIRSRDGGPIQTPITRADPEEIAFVVPTGAASGPVSVRVSGSTAVSPQELILLPSSEFELTLTPPDSSVMQGETTIVTATVTSRSGFDGLADLTLGDLPAGADGSLSPSRLAAGQMSELTLRVDPGLTPGTEIPLQVTATATVDGMEVRDTDGATIRVEPVTTSFVGRTVVADPLETPLAGVTVGFLGRDGAGEATGCTAQTVSDGAGNFALTGLPADCTGDQLVRYDGNTTDSPPGRYASVDLRYHLEEGKVAHPPVLVRLPRIDDAETIYLKQSAAEDQHFELQTIPGLEVTVYAGTVLTREDGARPDPYPLTALEIPVDRLPGRPPLPPDRVVAFLVAFQSANTTASQPLAVHFPNTVGTPPGTQVSLTTLDPQLGRMVIYGTGRISDDGLAIVPDFDPAHPGHRYGIVNFDWHGPVSPGPAENPAPPSAPGDCTPRAGDPVDLSSGLLELVETDLAIRGARGGISLRRTYRTLSQEAGPFGLGTNHDYGYRLDTNSPETARVVSLILPDGNRLPLTRGDGELLRNEAIPALRGAVLDVAPDGEAELRWKDGRVFQFEPAGFQVGSVLTAITDPNGNRVTLLRDPARPIRIDEIVGPAGRRLLLDYDAADRIVAATDPLGRTVTYDYDAGGRLIRVTDPAGGVTSYAYDGQDRLVRITDPRGVVVARNRYDANGRVAEQERPDGGVIHFDYTLLNPSLATSPVVRTVVTDPLGRRTAYRFNPQGFLLGVTDASGQTRVFEREARSNLLLAIRGAASCTVCGASSAGDRTFRYDALGNRIAETDALGQTTELTYDPVFNRVTSITDPLGEVTTFAYDDRGNLVSATDTKGRSTELSHDEHGQLVEAVDPSGAARTIEYDALGNPFRITGPLGNATIVELDLASRPVSITDALGRRSEVTYDALDRVTEVEDPAGHVTSTTYDAVGNLLSVTDPRGNTTAFSFDGLSRLETRTDSLGAETSYVYDLAGNLVETTDRRGQVNRYEYDEMDRLVREEYADGAVVDRIYGPQGRLLQVRDSAGGDVVFSYDDAGRLLSRKGPFGTVDYERDAVGRVTLRQVVGHPAVSYEYDAVGNLVSATMGELGIDLAYDERDLVVEETRSNGVRTDYAYDARGLVESIVHSNGPEILNRQSYTYDAVGNRASYTTDVPQPLPEAATFEIDPDSDRLLRRNEVTYTYDANGNRTTETGPDGTSEYVWDARNRLVELRRADGTTHRFRYDFEGLLIEHTVEAGGESSTRRFVRDDVTNIALIDADDQGASSVLTGRAIDSHHALSIQGGDRLFYLRDSLGSTVLSVGTDRQSRPVGYTLYGESDAKPTPVFGFTGRLTIDAGLSYFRARFYDPGAGRFVSPDPLGFFGGTSNRYLYTLANPTDFRDPFGLRSWRAIDTTRSPPKGSREKSSRLRPRSGRGRRRGTPTGCSGQPRRQGGASVVGQWRRGCRPGRLVRSARCEQ